jgi:oligopeptidase B
MLEDVDLFAGFFVACEREDGLPRLRIWRFAGDGPEPRAAGEIAFPEPAYSAHPHINRIFDTNTFRYATSRWSRPFGLRVRHATGASTLLKQLEIPGGFDRTLYASERVHATRRRRQGSRLAGLSQRQARAGRNPLYVYGYGSYGYSLPLGFSSNRLSLLDRGVVMAYAHIRGGGDLGKPWHDAGKMLVKRNTFTDFIAASST